METNAPASATQGFSPDSAFGDYLANQKKKNEQKKRKVAQKKGNGRSQWRRGPSEFFFPKLKSLEKKLK